MPARRRRRLGSDRLYITTDDGLPLGHLDLTDGSAHDVPAVWRERFVREANGWLWQNNLPPIPGAGDDEPAAIEAGVAAPEGGWSVGWDDLALHLPGHGTADEAARARLTGVVDADRPPRLRADGQHAVDDALAKLTRPRLRRGLGSRGGRDGGRWRILHAVEMTFDDPDGDRSRFTDRQRSGRERSPTALLDHLVIGPPGVFVVEVMNHPGGRVYSHAESLEVDDQELDLALRRRLGDEVSRRLSGALARAAGAAETLNPPQVVPVIAVVGAIVIGTERPHGVLVSRVGHLPRLLQAFGTPLVDQAVAQVHAVARRSDTWS